MQDAKRAMATEIARRLAELLPLAKDPELVERLKAAQAEAVRIVASRGEDSAPTQ